MRSEAERIAAAERLADDLWAGLRQARTEREQGGSVTYGGSIVSGDQIGHSGGTLTGDVVMGDDGRRR
jgi:hypothetical protein